MTEIDPMDETSHDAHAVHKKALLEAMNMWRQEREASAAAFRKEQEARTEAFTREQMLARRRSSVNWENKPELSCGRRHSFGS